MSKPTDMWQSSDSIGGDSKNKEVEMRYLHELRAWITRF